MAKSTDKEFAKELNDLKSQSIARMKAVIGEDGGWYMLSKEIAAHKAILGKLLGTGVLDSDEQDEQDAADLAEVTGSGAK